MTNKELKELKTAVRKVVKRAKTDKKFALEILVGTGMYTPTGRLKRRFR